MPLGDMDAESSSDGDDSSANPLEQPAGRRQTPGPPRGGGVGSGGGGDLVFEDFDELVENTITVGQLQELTGESLSWKRWRAKR